MTLFQTRLKEAMERRGLRATDLANRTGLSKPRISQYLKGQYVPKSDAVLTIAEALGVTPAWLMGREEEPEAIPCPPNMSPLRLCRYPILGEIACGPLRLAEEDPDGGYVTAAETTADFVLTAKGDSMTGARIFDGDEVFIQQTDLVNNGEIAAVVVEGEATLKRVYYYPEEERLVLKAENPRYDDLIFAGEALNAVRILGRAVAFQARLR